jgi:hypothetical protein
MEWPDCLPQKGLFDPPIAIKTVPLVASFGEFLAHFRIETAATWDSHVFLYLLALLVLSSHVFAGCVIIAHLGAMSVRFVLKFGFHEIPMGKKC